MDPEFAQSINSMAADHVALRLIVELMLTVQLKRGEPETATERLGMLWRDLSKEAAEIRLPDVPPALQDYAAEGIARSIDDILGSVRNRLQDT